MSAPADVIDFLRAPNLTAANDLIIPTRRVCCARAGLKPAPTDGMHLLPLVCTIWAKRSPLVCRGGFQTRPASAIMLRHVGP